MPLVTYYVALPFRYLEDGQIAAGEPLECRDMSKARSTAASMARDSNYCGAIAFSRTGDPAIGEFEDAVIITRLGEVDDARRGWWLHNLRRRGKNNRHRLHHLDHRRLGDVRKLDVWQFNLWRLDLGNLWRRRKFRRLDLDHRRLRLWLLDRNRLIEMSELYVVIHGLLGRGADDNSAQGKKNVERDGGEERGFALAAVVENAEVCELHILRSGIITAKRLCHKKILEASFRGRRDEYDQLRRSRQEPVQGE